MIYFLCFLITGNLLYGIDDAAKCNTIDQSQFGYSITYLECIDLSQCAKLNEFKPENIPVAGDPDFHIEFHKNSHRIVYLSKDKTCVIKIWQKNYFRSQQFLSACEKKFYEGIAIISAIIFDQEGECRGYITPYMLDRTNNRKEWNSYGFVLDKNKIGVKIFAPYDKQPNIYKKLFDQLIHKTKNTGLVMMDFCPNNCAIDPKTGNLYLTDLEDVDSVSEFKKLINEMYVYNPLDYVAKVLK